MVTHYTQIQMVTYYCMKHTLSSQTLADRNTDGNGLQPSHPEAWKAATGQEAIYHPVLYSAIETAWCPVQHIAWCNLTHCGIYHCVLYSAAQYTSFCVFHALWQQEDSMYSWSWRLEVSVCHWKSYN